MDPSINFPIIDGEHYNYRKRPPGNRLFECPGCGKVYKHDESYKHFIDMKGACDAEQTD